MKILFLTDSFNGMTQRLWIELDRLNHQVKVQITRTPRKMIEGVEQFKPELIIAPFLSSKIPSVIWQNHICLIVHPGIKGDRGASSLDWAILNNEKQWGVTLLQATGKMDAGAIWAAESFSMRNVCKAELYRNEVTQAAAKAILKALKRIATPHFSPEVLDDSNPEIKGKWNNRTTQKDFQFSWEDPIDQIIRKINAADSSPGVQIKLYQKLFYAYGGHKELRLKGKAGEVLAQRDQAICVATKNAAVWITHLKDTKEGSIKLPATLALGHLASNVSLSSASLFEGYDGETWQEIFFHQEEHIGYLHFNFYNGAMSTQQCLRLREAFVEAKKRVKLIVFMGGRDVWSNGIHLNLIENALNPAETSWENIQALNDLILEIIQSTQHYVICALQGNAGAGGVSLALSGDKILSRKGVILNPHTKNMGLYGSEYWTYLLPKRIGTDKAVKFTEECLPWGVAMAKEIGLIDGLYGDTNREFLHYVKQQAQKIIALPYFDKILKAKQFQRRKDELNKPLAKYRAEELTHMRANFFQDNLQFNAKRHDFVHKIINENTHKTEDLYSSRRTIYRKRKWESITYSDEKP